MRRIGEIRESFGSANSISPSKKHIDHEEEFQDEMDQVNEIKSSAKTKEVTVSQEVSKRNPKSFLDYFVSSQIKPLRRHEGKLDFGHMLSRYLEEMKELETSDTDYNEEIYKELNNLGSNHFNILLYGMGNLYQFCEFFIGTYLVEIGNVFQVNGSTPGVTMRVFFSKLTAFIVEVLKVPKKKQPSNARRVIDQLDWIQHILEEYHNGVPLIISVYSLDNLLKLDSDFVHYMAKLAQMPRIQLFCTLTNTTIFLGWDSVSVNAFNFLYYQMNTYLDYLKKDSYCVNIFSKHEISREKGFSYVIKSMAPIHLVVLEIIAEHQRNLPEEKGITFEEIISKATRTKGKNINAKALKEYISEFKDHKILQEKDEVDGRVHYTLNFTPDIIDKFLNNQLEEQYIRGRGHLYIEMENC